MADDRTSGREPVGYKRPPEESRFRQGQSGNPRGKIKGTRNRPKPQMDRLAALMLTEAYRLTKVSDEEGREITMPLAQAVFRSLTTAAARGETRAQAMFLKLVSTSEEEAAAYQRMIDDDLAQEDEAQTAELPREIEIRIVDPANPNAPVRKL